MTWSAGRRQQVGRLTVKLNHERANVLRLSRAANTWYQKGNMVQFRAKAAELSTVKESIKFIQQQIAELEATPDGEA